MKLRLRNLVVAMMLLTLWGPASTAGAAPPDEGPGLPPDQVDLAPWVSQFREVFGVPIFATNQVTGDDVDHVRDVLKAYLDNNRDGRPDNRKVVKELIRSNAGMVMFSNEDEAEKSTIWESRQSQKYELFLTSLEQGSNKIVESFGDLLRKLAKADALIGVGTDSPFAPFATGLHAELLLYEKAGLERWKILQAATRSSAIVAHAQRDLGTIEVGKLADMIVVSGDPLSRISDLLNLRYTIKNGRMYSLEELLHPPK